MCKPCGNQQQKPKVDTQKIMTEKGTCKSLNHKGRQQEKKGTEEPQNSQKQQKWQSHVY